MIDVTIPEGVLQRDIEYKKWRDKSSESDWLVKCS